MNNSTEEITRSEDLDKCLEVGLSVFLDLDPENASNERYRAVIRGWEKDRFILVERQSPGMKTLHRGRLCAVRMLHGGEVWGFYSTILDLVPACSDKKIHIAWPKRVSHLMVRRHERAQMDALCTAKLADGSIISGKMVDLSASGCRVQFKMNLPQNTGFLLSFTLPDGAPVQELAATVRHRVRRKGDQENDACLVFGCSFDQLDQSDKFGIGFYTARAIAEYRGEERNHPCVLILTSNADDMGFIRDALSGHVRYDLIRTQAILETIYRLYRYSVKAVLIRNEQRPMDPLRLCALFKQIPRFATLTVAVYGDGWNETADRQLAQMNAVWIPDMDKIQLLGHRLSEEEKRATNE